MDSFELIVGGAFVAVAVFAVMRTARGNVRGRDRKARQGDDDEPYYWFSPRRHGHGDGDSSGDGGGGD